MKRYLPLAASAVALASGCTTLAGSKNPPDALMGQVYYGTETTIGDCPKTPSADAAESGVGAALLTAAISQGVSKIGEALKNAAKEETQTALAQRNVEIRTNKGIGRCVLVARGWFYKTAIKYGEVPNGSRVFEVNKNSAFPGNSHLPYIQTMWEQGLTIAATPDFFFKGLLTSSREPGAYTILPVQATFDRPISSNTLRPTKARSVMVAFAMTPAGTGVDLAKSGTTLRLGRMTPGEMLEFPTNQRCFSYKGPNANQVAAGECPGDKDMPQVNLIVRNPAESDWFKVETSEKLSPMTVQALVTETRSESKFLSFVAAVFGDSSKAINEELQHTVIPSVAATADAAALTADEAKSKTYDLALAKASTELAACIASPADLSKRANARVAVRDFVAAARASGKDDFKMDAEAIPAIGTKASECQKEHDKIK